MSYNPFYQSDCGMITIYHADCLDILPQIPRGDVDAIIADPPYGYKYVPSRMGSKNSCVFRRNFGPEDLLDGDSGDMDFDPSPFLSLPCAQIWWGANCYANKLPNSRSWLVWFKADGNTMADQGHAELAWTNLDKAIRGFNHRWYGMVKDSERNSTPQHPTQKPISAPYARHRSPHYLRTRLVGRGKTGSIRVHWLSLHSLRHKAWDWILPVVRRS